MIRFHLAGASMKVQRPNSAPRAQQRMTIVGAFDDGLLVDAAVTELARAGFKENDIGIAARHGRQADALHDNDAANNPPAEILSSPFGVVGVLTAVRPMICPPVGWSDPAVSLATIVAATGVAGLTRMLIDAGVPEHETRYFRHEFEAGRTIVTVAADHRSREARAILRRHGAYDMISGILSRSAQ
jgi:hypothetical protein